MHYLGRPDGEGCILGTWTIDTHGFHDSGGFGLRPALKKPTGDEPIQEIGR